MKGECYSYQTAELGHGDRRKKKRKTRDDGSYHTAQFGLGEELGLDLIWIEIGVLKIQGMSPLAL